MRKERNSKDARVEAIIDSITVHSTLPDERHSAENSLERLMARREAVSITPKAYQLRIRRYKIWLAAASVAFFMTLGGLFLMKSSNKDVQYIVATNNTGSIEDVTLSDGSVVKLNTRSKLTYPETFSRKRREVFLDGEAYFEVVHDRRHPFIVRAGELNIKVLGTKFNVNATSIFSDITTTLLEGSVDVISENGHVLMKPGQQLVFNTENKEIRLSKLSNAERAIDWTKNVWALSNTSLLDICSRLEYLYDVRFVIMNDELIKKSYTGQFDSDESLESILETMETSTPFVYERKGRNIIIR